MSVVVLTPESRWPELNPHARYPRLNGHSEYWSLAVANGLRHSCYTLVHHNERSIPDGILPLMEVKSLLFGRFLVSLPYLNTGGVWSDNEAAAHALVDAACELADKLDVRYLELRHEVRLSHPRLNFERDDKVHMRLALPCSDAALDASFKSKLRSQIRKAVEYDLSVEWGGQPLLSHFYDIFARNMRDLGTPVFSKRLFREILDQFPGNAELCVVRRRQLPIASAILVHSHGVTEVPSASSLREHNFTNANMWMYRQLLSRAIQRGSHTFDFGRSSEGGGTYQFKAQWNALPSPAIWQYYVRKGSVDEMRPDSSGKQKLVRIWQKLPVWLTRLAGPRIVRGIP